MITVLIVDDQHLVRAGIRSLLERAEDIEVVGEATDGESGWRAVLQHRPDVVLTSSFREGFYGSPAGWNHVDQRVLGEAVVDAVRDAGNPWVFPELVDEGHPPWDGVRFVLVGSSPLSKHFVDISDSIDRGMESLRAHVVYFDALGGSAETEAFLRRGAAAVGAEAGVAAALPVELI